MVSPFFIVVLLLFGQKTPTPDNDTTVFVRLILGDPIVAKRRISNPYQVFGEMVVNTSNASEIDRLISRPILSLDDKVDNSLILFVAFHCVLPNFLQQRYGTFPNLTNIVNK